MSYNYVTIDDIDIPTVEYLEFAYPGNIHVANIEDVNEFLTKLDGCFEELETA